MPIKANSNSFSIENFFSISLNDLSKLVDINSYEDNGNVTVIIGKDWTLVQNNNFSPIESSYKGGETGMLLIDGIATHDSRRDLSGIFREGEIKELMDMRDKTIINYMDEVDKVAFAISREVNNLHATGTGINSASNSITSSYSIKKDSLNLKIL